MRILTPFICTSQVATPSTMSACSARVSGPAPRPGNYDQILTICT